MKTKIIGFAGAKQSGKTTAANFLHGCQLKSHGIVKDFSILEDGNLVVETEVVDQQGVETFGSSILEVSRNDLEFTEWALFSMWPFVKKYSFAGTLKQIATELFKIPRECVYGTDEQKNQPQEHLRWENMPTYDFCPRVRNSPGPMTAREFLQYLGTDVMRKMYEPIWVESVIADIRSEKPLLAIVDDVRFLNEIEAIQNVGGKVIGLTRQPFESSHSSEDVAQHMDSLDGCVGAEKNIHDMCQDILDFMTDFGWLSDQVEVKDEPLGQIASRLQGGIHSIKENK